LIDPDSFASAHLRDFFVPGRELCGAIKKMGSIGLSPALPSPRTLERARKGEKGLAAGSELPYLFELIYSAYFQAYKRNCFY
jgi:hypothetical protein